MSDDADVRAIFSLIQKIAGNVLKDGKPSDVLFGTVTNTTPLRVRVNQKLELEESQLILTNSVRDYEVKLTTKGDDNEPTVTTTQPVNDGHYTGTAAYAGGGADPTAFLVHNHSYSGDKWFKVNLSLKIGEKVILLRCAGAQQYVILDRVEAPKKGAM